MKARVALGLSLLVFGCKNKGGGDGDDKVSGPSAFTAWMPKNAVQAWDGAFVTRMHLQSNKKKHTSMAGDPVALEIKGGKATVNGGDKDQELGFDLEAPCSARFSEAITEGSMKGGTSYVSMNFVIENGGLVIGSGAGGYRKGKAAIVCSGSGVHIVDDKGGCVTWEKKFREWEQKPNTCAWSQADGKDVLTIGTDDWKTVVIAQGDVLASEQFRDSSKNHTKAKDFADAKAQLAAKLKADDPGEQAKAKGGVVGKTDTVLSLIATFSSDPSLQGKPIELTAQYLNSNSFTSNGTKKHNVILVDGKGQAELSVTCDLGETAPPEGLVQYDKVTAKGTIRESFGKPELEGCTVAKAP